MDDALLSAKPRRMRCASCRSVFEAVAPTTNQFPPAILPPTAMDATSVAVGSADPDVPGETATSESAAEPLEDGQIDFDAIGMDTDAAISQPVDPFDAIVLPEPALNEDTRDPAERALEAAAARREKLAQEADNDQDKPRHIPASGSGFRKPSAGVVLMVGGLWTLMTIGIFRNEVVRLVPEAIPAFSALGLDVNRSALDILEVKSAVSIVENQEMLEVSGKITNLSKVSQKLPVLRLALRNAAGLDVYVWTSNADKAEIAAGETSSFTRKLASPPPDAQSVMVRFVAKDDIVSAIH